MDVEPSFIRPRSSWPCTACLTVPCRDVRESQRKIFRHLVKLAAKALKIDNLVLALFLFAVVYLEMKLLFVFRFCLFLLVDLKDRGRCSDIFCFWQEPLWFIWFIIFIYYIVFVCFFQVADLNIDMCNIPYIQMHFNLYEMYLFYRPVVVLNYWTFHGRHPKQPPGMYKTLEILG